MLLFQRINNAYFIGFICILFLSSCSKDVLRGSGSVSSRELNLTNFTGVETHYDIDAQITYSNQFKVAISGYDNLLNELDYQITNGILKLSFKNQYHSVKNSNVKAVIEMPNLQVLGIYGSGNLLAKGFEQGNKLNLHIHGSGDIEVQNSVYQELLLRINGSGNIDTKNTQTNSADVAINGSGDIYVKPTSLLKASINGSGNIYYYGNPQITITQNGSGRIIKK
ncbi:MAG: head GIN domain-containing protein [Chitinophagaceae bacterium]